MDIEETLQALYDSGPPILVSSESSKKGQKPRAITQPNTIACHDTIELIFCNDIKSPQKMSFINFSIDISIYDALVIPAGCPHRRIPSPYDDYDYEDLIYINVKIPDFNIDSPILVKDRRGILCTLFTMINSEYHHGYNHPYLVEYYIKALISDILLIYRDASMLSPVSSTAQYIRDHYAEDLSLETLSEMEHISKSYLCRQFKKLHGTTISNYINKIRVQHAKEELINTSKTIEEIAYDVGFDSSKYFSQVFKAFTSLTPTQFRILNANTQNAENI